MPPTNVTDGQTASSSSISPETAAVIVAIVVPAVVIAIAVLCFFQIKKHWKLDQTQAATPGVVDAGTESVCQSENAQLYLQHKAELNVERQRTRHEMQSEGEIYELMDRGQCQEMPAEDTRQPALSLAERHELRGEDHASELNTSQDQQILLRGPHRYSFDEPVFVDFNDSVLSLHEFA